MSNQPPAGPPEGWEQPHQQGWGSPPQQPPPQRPGWGPPPGPPAQPQPQWGHQPPGPPQAPRSRPPWYKRPGPAILAAAGVGLVLFLIIGALAGDPESTSAPKGTSVPTTAAQATTTPTSAESEPETTAKPTTTARQTDVGNAVRDGGFEFLVSRFSCRAGRCSATMHVENIGNDPGTMFASNQYLFDDQDRRFAADDTLTDPLFFQELNPGQTVRGTVIWKVGSGTKPAHLELHDSLFPAG